MSNVSKLSVSLMNGRVSKGKNDQTGHEYAGIYYPSNGTTPARWEGNIFVNGMPYTDAKGVRQEPKAAMIRMVAWNGQNSKPGKGIADICARSLSPGKEISGLFSIKSFDKRLFIDNTPQVDHTGRPITYPALSFVLEGLPILGNDSADVVLSEINTFRTTGIAATFGARPAFWNVPNHPDVAVWDVIKKARREAQYTPGAATYGYARVIVPAGAVVPQMPVDNATLMAQLQAFMAANGAAAAPVAPVAPPITNLTGGIDPVMMAQMLAAFSGQTVANSVPPATTAAAGTLLAGQTAI